jgi:hypothetical protein
MLKPILKIHKELQKEGCPKRKKKKKKEKKMEYANMVPILIHFFIKIVFKCKKKFQKVFFFKRENMSKCGTYLHTPILCCEILIILMPKYLKGEKKKNVVK